MRGGRPRRTRPGRGRGLAGLLALGVLATIPVACSSEPGAQVLVIGDSLTVGATQQGLGDDRPETWEISAETGRTTDEGVTAAKAYDIADFDVVIVALGTNDYLDPTDTYAARIDAMMAVLKDAPRVIWVDVDTGGAVAQAAEGVNPAIAAAPDRFANLEVGGWNAYLASQPEPDQYRAGDDIHYQPSGYELRARWMEQLV